MVEMSRVRLFIQFGRPVWGFSDGCGFMNNDRVGNASDVILR